MNVFSPTHLSDLNGTGCPGCHRSLAALPPQATFCPGCGRRLRPPRSIQSIARGLVARFGPTPEPPIDRTGPRTAVVVGYGNALWRLGWRYEHGRGTMRNVPEAMRCYHKSAGLGNVEADTRLRAGTPQPVITLPADERLPF